MALFPQSAIQATNNNGNPMPGAKWKFYLTGTTTPATVYADADLVTPLGSEVTADDTGWFAPVYLDNAVVYRAKLTTPAGATIGSNDIDPVDNGVSTFVSDLAASTGSNTVGFLQSGTGAVARTVQGKLRDTVSVKDFGAVGDGSTSDGAAIVLALQAGAASVYVPKGDYAITAPITATLTRDTVLYGEGRFVYTGAPSTSNLFVVQCAGYSFDVLGLTFDGGNLISGGPRIENQGTMTNPPSCRFEGNTLKNFRMAAASLWNDGAVIRGSFERVVVEKNTVKDITRAAGTGTPGSTGTTGITVANYDATRWVKECHHYGNTYDNISGDDLVGSANNVDYDGFRFFTPSPLSFPNSDSSVYAYGLGRVESYGNSYRNCRGRALKVQGLALVSGEKIVRDGDYTIYGASTEINLQYGAGTVRDCEFHYNDYLVSSTVTSPIQTALVLVSVYQGSWYNEAHGGVSVSGIKVFNGIKTGTGVNISAVLEATAGATPAGKERLLISLSDVVMNRGQIDYIATLAFDTGVYGKVVLDTVTVPKLTYSAIGSDYTSSGCEVIANAVINADGDKTPANKVKFFSDTSPAGGNLAWAGKVSGALNRGFLHNYNVGADFNTAPMLNGAALADPTGGTGGALSVQSAYLADDASYAFERRFFNSSRGLVSISVGNDYTGQGIFALGSNQVHLIAGHASHLFEPSTTGSNIDTDGKFNVWFSGDQLNVKNRLGSTYPVTVSFLG